MTSGKDAREMTDPSNEKGRQIHGFLDSLMFRLAGRLGWLFFTLAIRHSDTLGTDTSEL
jgi:hypothetical protein